MGGFSELEGDRSQTVSFESVQQSLVQFLQPSLLHIRMLNNNASSGVQVDGIGLMQFEKRQVEPVSIPIEDHVDKRRAHPVELAVGLVGQLDVVHFSKQIDDFDASNKMSGHLLFGLFLHLHEETHLLREGALLGLLLYAVRLLCYELLPVLVFAALYAVHGEISEEDAEFGLEVGQYRLFLLLFLLSLLDESLIVGLHLFV